MALARSLLAVLALPASALAGTTWHVDASAACPGFGTVHAPYCTIQAGLDAAAPGDLILVAPGTYPEHLDFLGKDVELRSTVAAVVTIVDGGGDGSVVSFVGGEGRGAVLQGFTLRNGSGLTEDTGGGVTCVGSSPTIRGNIFESNVAERGGGVQVVDGAPLLVANSIHNNTATHGAGIYCQGEELVEIIGNQISFNGPTGTTGGGIAVNGGSAHIEANLIQGNITSGGAGLSIETSHPVLVRGNTIRVNHTDEGDGGGLFVFGDLVVVEENEIEHNTALGDGGALWAFGGTFRNNHISGNLSQGGFSVVARAGTSFDGDRIVDNDGLVAALMVVGVPTDPAVTLRRVTLSNDGLTAAWIFADAVFEDCLIVDNDEGLIISDPTTQVTLRRCTLSGNTESFAVLTQFGAHADVESCVVWGNALLSGLELFPESGTIDASWSIVRLGYPGIGNLDDDPLFANAADGDFSLLVGSPAIDSADPLDGVCGFDLAGTPRRLDGHLDVGSEVDRGALEFANAQLAASEPSSGVLQLDLTGTAGLPAFIFGALSPGELCLEKWGTFGMDLGGTFVVAPWFPAPSSIQANIAPALSGLPVVLQVLVGAPSGFAQTGNLTQPVALELP